MRHLITTDDLSSEEIENLFADAESYLLKPPPKLLQNRLVITLFFENSTRTRSSFEIAAKKLGADVVHLDVARSSTKKGETLYDTAANDAIVVRHAQSGTPYQISRHVDCAIFNAGDGAHAHPSQALLDLFTIKRHFGSDIEGKKIAIVGDIKNSRVANSNMRLLPRFGLEITLVAPPHFMPETDFPLGPVHRNIDIDDAMLADPRCKVLEQVRNGVAVRMAALKKLILANG